MTNIRWAGCQDYLPISSVLRDALNSQIRFERETKTTDTNRQWWIPLIEGENVPPFCWFESLLETFFVIERFWLKTTRMWQKMFLSVKNLFKLWKPLSYSQFSLLSASEILEFVSYINTNWPFTRKILIFVTLYVLFGSHL